MKVGALIVASQLLHGAYTLYFSADNVGKLQVVFEYLVLNLIC